MNEKKLGQAGVNMMSAKSPDIIPSLSSACKGARAFVEGLVPVRFNWTGSVLTIILRSTESLDEPALRKAKVALRQVEQICVRNDDERITVVIEVARLAKLDFPVEYPTRMHLRAVFDVSETGAHSSVSGEGRVRVEYAFADNAFARNSAIKETLESLKPRRFLARDRELFVWYNLADNDDEIAIVADLLDGVASLQFKRGAQVFFRNITVDATVLRRRILRVRYLLAKPMPSGWHGGRIVNQETFSDPAAKRKAEQIADREARFDALWSVADAAEVLWRKSGSADFKFVYHGHVYRRT